ncbi:hypothetical protein J31TS6_59140 [Brevibacillus reuszeri]|uniref:hypothetical protein n=1 Tax=Brevibacillus reuszeri TaxID=54915 RepID=UPI001B095CC5|nr:hypothetical protein [Brevibacillus reuszeri]GIO09886.1 hypothetical protein J31TS6_59140 [Brevibacillus reuszeri]
MERFKKLSLDNWLEGDRTTDYFVWYSEYNKDFYKPSNDQRVEALLVYRDNKVLDWGY